MSSKFFNNVSVFSQGGSTPLKNDDILAVFYNLDHMTTLLFLEFSSHSNLKCFDYLLSENILDKLYSWSQQTGRSEFNVFIASKIILA